MIKQRKMQERAEPCRMHRCKCVTKPRWAIPRTLGGTQSLFAVSSVKLHLTASNTYTYIYIHPFSKTSLFQNMYIIYSIWLCLFCACIFFFSTRKDMYAYRKKNCKYWPHHGAGIMCVYLAYVFFRHSYKYMIYISEIAMFL